MASISKRKQKIAQKAFLTVFAECACVAHAAQAAGVSYGTVMKWKKDDPVFAELYDDALENGIGILEMEAHRRAYDGVPKGVWYKGERVGEDIVYSDGLLTFLLKAHRPETYRERSEVKHSGHVSSEVITTYRLPDNGRD